MVFAEGPLRWIESRAVAEEEPLLLFVRRWARSLLTEELRWREEELECLLLWRVDEAGERGFLSEDEEVMAVSVEGCVWLPDRVGGYS